MKSDVYSFGVLLLEIACGRRLAMRVEDDYYYYIHLVQWVWDAYGSGSILDAADARLSGEFDGREVACMMVVGLCGACTRIADSGQRSGRPSMCCGSRRRHRACPRRCRLQSTSPRLAALVVAWKYRRE